MWIIDITPNVLFMELRILQLFDIIELKTAVIIYKDNN